MKNRLHLLVVISAVLWQSCSVENRVIWQIGEANNSSSEFALAPTGYQKYIERDFGWEDKFFLIGASDCKIDWPYVIPGPSDNWGGTGGTSGWRSSTLNILFGVDKLPKSGGWKLTVDILDCNSADLPLFKVIINGKPWKYRIPAFNKNDEIENQPANSSEYLIEIPIPKGLITKGGNEIKLTTIEGSWLKFDNIKLEGPGKVILTENKQVYLRDINAVDYEVNTSNRTAQPLLIDIQHLSGTPELTVILEGAEIFAETIEKGRYVFEAPMPAVISSKKSKYKILIDGKEVQTGIIERSPQKLITLAEYANTKMGTAHSRWMIAPGPWMPFSMVKLSPDNQNEGWQAGYDPIFETIGGFSHIHEWTMGGLSFMPTNGKLITKVGDQRNPDDGYRSHLNKETEEAPIGYYKAELTDYAIVAELTATTRGGFQRYTFPKEREGSRILLDLQNPAEYSYKLEEVFINKISDTRVEGFSKQLSPNTWSGGISQQYVVYFVAEFDQPIKNYGFWTEDGIRGNTTQLKAEKCNGYGEWLRPYETF